MPLSLGVLTNLTPVEYLKRHFLNHPACFLRNRPLIDRWTFCSKCWDIYPAHCTGLQLFPELSQNEICYILHPKYPSFSCSPIISVCAIWKPLFIEIRVTPFLISWRRLTECYSKLLPTNSGTCLLFYCIFYESISIDVSKKVYMISCNLWICSKNVASSRIHYL